MTIIKRNERDHNQPIVADICIIGGGVVGLSTALSLATKNPNKKIVLLESGLDKPGHGQSSAEGEIIGEGVQSLASSRIRALGGTEWVWGGHSRPFDPIDFEQRDWVENSGWPITYNEFAKYISAATKILDIDDSNWSNIHPSINYLNIDKTQIFESCHFKLSPQVAADSKANTGTFAQSRLKELESTRNLNIYLDHTVVSLQYSPDKKAVVSVVTKGVNSPEKIISASKFILATGGIENGRLLKYWFGRKDAPKLPCFKNIGRYFMEHPHRDVAKVMISESQIPQYKHHFGARMGSAVHMIRLKITDQALRQNRLNSQTIIVVKTKNNKFNNTLLKAITICEQIPSPSNRVELSEEKDLYGILKPILHWGFDKQDFYSMNFVAKEFPKFTGMNSIGRPQSIIYPLGTKLPGGHHHMGTTRMGETSSNAVVDKNCKVFDVDNFYVAGGSVFPTSGGVNPTLNMLALSQRLVDYITKQG